MTTSTTRRSAATLTLSAVFTLAILGGIQGLASKPVADAMLAKQGGQPLVVGTSAQAGVKS